RRSAPERRVPAPGGARVGRPLRARRRRLAHPVAARLRDSADRRARAPRSLARAVGVRADRHAPVGGVDPASKVGIAVTLTPKRRRPWLGPKGPAHDSRRAALSGPPRGGPERPALQASAAAAALLVFLLSTPLMAAERYALVITGASGGETYQQKYD